MKEKILEKSKMLGIMLIITLLISIPYLNFKDISVHDISYHTNRIVSISEELRMGNFPVLIHSNLIYGFGYANSIFYPELFLYIPAVFILIGIDFLTSYKLMLMISTFFTLLFSYYSANKIFEKKNVAWTVSILYSTALYRLTDMYIRGAIGEVLALVFLPLVICGLYEIIFGENKKWWIICFGIFGVINSHVLSFAMIIVLILIICLLNCKPIFKDRKRLINLVLAGIISILLACSFAFPYLEQSRNDKFNVDEKIYSGEFLKSYSVSLREIPVNQFYINDEEFYKGVGIILLILSPLVMITKNKDNQSKFMKQLCVLGFIMLFITTSLFPWVKVCNKYNFITTIQFPYRLNIIITVLFSFTAGYALCNILKDKEKLNKLSYIILIVVTLILLSTLNINYSNFDRDKIIEFAPIGNGEYVPYGLHVLDDKVHNVSNENAIDFTRRGSRIEFYYNSNDEENMIIHIPFTYYKGYKAYIETENGERKSLDVSEAQVTRNVIVSSNEKLSGNVVVEYKMTKVQKISYGITLITFICLVVYIVLEEKGVLKKVQERYKNNEKR